MSHSLIHHSNNDNLMTAAVSFFDCRTRLDEICRIVFKENNQEIFESFAEQELPNIEAILTPIPSSAQDRAMFAGHLLDYYGRPNNYHTSSVALMSFLEKNKPDFAVLSVALSCCLENYFRHPIIAEIKKEIDDAAQYLNKMLRLIKGDPKVSNDCSLVDKCRAHFERQNKERFYWAGI